MTMTLNDMLNSPLMDRVWEGLERYPYSDFLRDQAQAAGIRLVYVDCSDALLSYRCDRCNKRHLHKWIEGTGDLGPRPSKCPHDDGGLIQLLPKAPIVWFLPPIT